MLSRWELPGLDPRQSTGARLPDRAGGCCCRRTITCFASWGEFYALLACGAEGGIRTRTSRSSQPPEDCVSTNFTTSARLVAEAGFEPAAKGL